jgi:CubicO group peptidase (beta-lactamase class C family)
MTMRLRWIVGVAAVLLAGSAQAQSAAQQWVGEDSVILTVPLDPGEVPIALTLREMMDLFRVPGFSVAVIEDHRIAWSAGFGVVAPGSTTPVTPDTLFQAASISKPVTALGALWLVERGRLALDADVNTVLKGWKVPENALTATQKVTLRRLLSHNAGTSVHGFAGYPRGAPLPTIPQMLDGVAPANNAPVRVIAQPGSACIYSGGGTIIASLLMREASGEPFEAFMAERVLGPAGMRSSSFVQALPPALAARAATGTRADGKAVPGKWHVYPELAPDGLWTTAEDLARLAIEVSLSRAGKANHILSQAMTREMLTPHCREAPGDTGGMGLGFGVGYGGHPGQFRHTGGNDGFQSLLFMDADKGWGIALLGNSDAFHLIYPQLLRTIAAAKGWQHPARPLPLPDRLGIVAARRGLDRALALYDRARSDDAREAANPATLNSLGYQLLRRGAQADAIRVFERNVALHPGDANAYDSLGEAYAATGKTDAAIRNYARALELDPGNANAKAWLERLRG